MTASRAAAYAGGSHVVSALCPVCLRCVSARKKRVSVQTKSRAAAGPAPRRRPGESRSEQGQAHLPAEQPPPGAYARLSAADAHPRRTRHRRRSPPQGPRAALGLSGAAPVLPAGSRLTHRDEFASAVRRGLRAGRPRLVIHLSTANSPDANAPARAGFVVGRAVGGSVTRHRVTRRLRHLVRDRLAALPPGAQLVVRALPPAADAPSSTLADDLDSGLRAVLRRAAGSRS